MVECIAGCMMGLCCENKKKIVFKVAWVESFMDYKNKNRYKYIIFLIIKGFYSIYVKLEYNYQINKRLITALPYVCLFKKNMETKVFFLI